MRLHQSDRSPCCGAVLMLFPSMSEVMCHECRNNYDTDYKSGFLLKEFTVKDVGDLDNERKIDEFAKAGRLELNNTMINKEKGQVDFSDFDVNSKVNKVSASDILSSAAKHLTDRAISYDSQGGERSIRAAIDAFNTVTGDGRLNTAERGWLFMCLLKLVRAQAGGTFKLDNYEDLAAYAALMGEEAAWVASTNE